MDEKISYLSIPIIFEQETSQVASKMQQQKKLEKRSELKRAGEGIQGR